VVSFSGPLFNVPETLLEAIKFIGVSRKLDDFRENSDEEKQIAENNEDLISNSAELL
jgi:hypothetical protein